METVLRLFWPRFVMLGVLLLIGLFLGAGVALAQDAAPAAVPPAPDLISLWFSSASAVVVSLMGALLAVATRHAPAWVVGFVDHLTTSEAVKWEALLDSAMERAEAYARSKFDLVKDRAGYLNAMVMFMHTFNPEIVRWADKNNNGVIDLIESRLPAGSVPPPKAPADIMPIRSTRKREVN